LLSLFEECGSAPISPPPPTSGSHTLSRLERPHWSLFATFRSVRRARTQGGLSVFPFNRLEFLFSSPAPFPHGSTPPLDHRVFAWSLRRPFGTHLLELDSSGSLMCCLSLRHPPRSPLSPSLELPNHFEVLTHTRVQLPPVPFFPVRVALFSLAAPLVLLSFTLHARDLSFGSGLPWLKTSDFCLFPPSLGASPRPPPTAGGPTLLSFLRVLWIPFFGAKGFLFFFPLGLSPRFSLQVMISNFFYGRSSTANHRPLLHYFCYSCPQGLFFVPPLPSPTPL